MCKYANMQMCQCTNDMKTKIFLIISCCFFVVFLGCSTDKKNANVQNETVLQVDTIFVRDTVFLYREYSVSTMSTTNTPTSIDNYIYLTLNRIFWGNSRWEAWQDEQGKSFVYRLLSTHKGRLYVEKIGWIGSYDEHYLANRVEICPQIFGMDDFVFLQKVEWISPTIVKLLVNDKEYALDIPRMKVVE